MRVRRCGGGRHRRVPSNPAVEDQILVPTARGSPRAGQRNTHATDAIIRRPPSKHPDGWRLLYETAARTEEILTLNVEDLDPEFRRGRVTSKGGAIEYVQWATPTARLLPQLLVGRTSWPVFLADRRAPTSGPRVPADGDIDPTTRRGRLSYPRAEYLFKTASATLYPHHQGWTLHQLRHSALQHLAQAGRSAPELQAKSRHQHLAGLGRYVRLGEETSARITAEHDPAARRRRSSTADQGSRPSNVRRRSAVKAFGGRATRPQVAGGPGASFKRG
ncbi:site-specific integrase [Nonomuraea sp. NPDC046802]|uniref:site-specific integrase n=1 Tax=Nonomuraea sp. NPDC046802 TaxID=3154919 RepID=UPI0033D37E87